MPSISKRPKLTPPLKWHGGKHYLAPKIVAMMPKHTHYVEPYFGGGAVLLAKNPNGVSEVVNDIHYDLSNFWMVLADELLFPVFKRAVEVIPFSEVVYDEVTTSRGWPGTRHPKVKSAVEFFVRCRQSMSGRMDSFAPLTRNRVRRGMNEQVSAWLNSIEGLPAVHKRMIRVAILSKDALKVIKQQDGPKTLYYLDPPYLSETRASKNVYAHEMTVKQHKELLMTLNDIKGKFMLSGYRNKMYDEWAYQSGFNSKEFNLPNNSAGGKSKRRMIETLWYNF